MVTVNDAFLKSLARQQRGGCWLQTPDDDIAGTVSALGDRLRRPVLSQLAVEGSWETGAGTLPDLHAREVVTAALRGNTEGPINVTGFLPDGTAHSFTVALGNAGSEAVKLLWAQQRIASLLESGREQEAIALARTHNLICEGAAFIAWDEKEQVPIAKHELLIPASVMRLAEYASQGCGGGDPQSGHVMHAAPILRSRASRSPSPGDDFMLFCSRPDDHLMEDSDRKENADAQLQSLRSILRSGNVPDSIAERLIVWAKGGADSERSDALIRAMKFIAKVRRELGPRLDETIHRLIESSPEKIMKWEEKSRPGFEALIELRDELSALGAPDEMNERLIAWVVESGGFDRDRIQRISEIKVSIEYRLFSARARQQLWQRFLDEILGATRAEPQLFP